MKQIILDVRNIEDTISILAPLMKSLKGNIEDYVPAIPHTPLPKSGYRGVSHVTHSGMYKGSTTLRGISIVVAGTYNKPKMCANVRDHAMKVFGIPCRLTDGTPNIPTKAQIKRYSKIDSTPSIYKKFSYVNKSLLDEIIQYIENN